MPARVLVVDDDPDIRMLLRMTLPMSPVFDVVGEAEGGAQAVELTASLEPDLVLMDVMMPGMNGIEATTQIKQRFPHVHVVGFTASGDEGVREMLDAGATAVVDKSYVGDLSTRLVGLTK